MHLPESQANKAPRPKGRGIYPERFNKQLAYILVLHIIPTNEFLTRYQRSVFGYELIARHFSQAVETD